MSTDPKTWIADPEDSTVTDLTPAWPYGDMCDIEHPGWSVVCTRTKGHTGRHAAGDGKKIVAVWR